MARATASGNSPASTRPNWIEEAAAPPADRLPLTPVIRDDGDLTRAGRELSYLKSSRETVNAACQQRIELVKAEAQRQLVTDVDGDEVPFAVRETLLEEAVKKYAGKHRNRLIEEFGGGKTLNLTHGEVAWRSKPAGVAIVDGKSADDVVAKIGKLFEGGLPGALVAILQEAEIAEGIGVDQVLRLKIDLDRTALAKLHRDGRISKTELRKFALCAIPADETCSLKVYDYPVSEVGA